MLKLETDSLPPYIMRKSARARHLQLKITRQGELQIVVPKRISLKQAQLFLLENLAWVRAREHLLFESRPPEWPHEVSLQAIGCSWPLKLEFGRQRSGVKESLEGLQVGLREESLQHFNQVMTRWLKRKAVLELTPWMERLSQQCQLPFTGLSFRGQKTLWGSCSRLGHICLNYKLLLLPSQYVDYVMIHELCHTKHFNHSKRFWALLASFVPDWRKVAREARVADRLLPDWI